jgi:hypothetical protein
VVLVEDTEIVDFRDDADSEGNRYPRLSVVLLWFNEGVDRDDTSESRLFLFCDGEEEANGNAAKRLCNEGERDGDGDSGGGGGGGTPTTPTTTCLLLCNEVDGEARGEADGGGSTTTTGSCDKCFFFFIKEGDGAAEDCAIINILGEVVGSVPTSFFFMDGMVDWEGGAGDTIVNENEDREDSKDDKESSNFTDFLVERDGDDEDGFKEEESRFGSSFSNGSKRFLLGLFCCTCIVSSSMN